MSLLKQLMRMYGLDLIIGLDWETYWANDYRLGKKWPTTEYVTSERFKPHMCSIQHHNWTKARVLSPAQVNSWKHGINWSRTGILAHHAHFDGLIASHHFGIKPKFYFDTLSMARALMPIHVSKSLDPLCKALGLQGKVGSDILVDTKGKRDLTRAEYKLMASYAGNDIEQTWLAFFKMAPYLPLEEFDLIDSTVKMYAQPSVLIDEEKMRLVTANEVDRKDKLFTAAKSLKSDLSRNEPFIAKLNALGIDTPMKISPKAKKLMASEDYVPTHEDMVPALSKQDQEFKDLLKHPNAKVRMLVEARFAAKSANLEKKSTRLAERSTLGAVPIYLNYSGAKTHRWSGADGVNMQNMDRGSGMRKAIHAPKGHVLIIADQAQIEARFNAWFSGQTDKVEAFRAKKDVYKLGAADIYHKHISEITPEERFVGKTCIAEGTLVLCDGGWKPIETVTTGDLLWDGENWVRHCGLANNGLRETQQVCGVWLTPDHKIFTGETWLRADQLLCDTSTQSQASAYAAASLPSQVMSSALKASARSSCVVNAAGQSTHSTGTIFGSSTVRAAMYALRAQLVKSATGCTQRLCRTMNTARDCLIGLLRPSLDATAQAAGSTQTMVDAVSLYATSGATTARRFSATCSSFRAGMNRLAKWTGLTTTSDTSRGTSASLRAQKTRATSGASENSKRKLPVYDLLSSGPKNRFTVKGDAGPLIVHNCELGLGYQAGGPRLGAMLRIGQFGPPVDISDRLATDIKDAWRRANFAIVQGWKETQSLIRSAFEGKQRVEHKHGIVYEGRGNVGYIHHVPTGMSMRFDGVQVEGNGDLTYISEYRHNFAAPPYIARTKLYAGVECENRTQFMARMSVAANIRTIKRALSFTRLALTTHDEVLLVCPIRRSDRALRDVVEIMQTPPSWAEGMPFGVDAHISEIYDK